LIGTEEIRKIPQFSGQTTGVTQSDLQFKNGYLVYSSSFGGNLVDEFTVRDFLDNSNNEKIATDFFNYLQSNYSKPEFNELYYNNSKLANTLNDYYTKTIVDNVAPTKTVANLQLTATTAVTYTSTSFVNYDKRSIQKITAIIGYNTGDSYYISVPISSSYNILDNPNYDKYRINSLGNPQQYLYAEWFRYALKKNSVVTNQNVVVHTNSFNNYTQRNPIGLNVPQLRIQFKNDKFVIPENTLEFTKIPIEIVFDNPANFTGQTFQLKIESANGTDAIIAFGNVLAAIGGGAGTNPNIPPAVGTDIGLVEGQNNNLIAQNILIPLGQSSVTATLSINSQRIFAMADLDIKLILLAGTNIDYDTNKATQSYSVSSEQFSILTSQPNETQIQDDTSYDYVKESIRTRPQYLLQSFVDLNFNDSESEFYRNKSSTAPSLIPGLIVASPPPPPPPPPAPTSHNPNINPADLTKNSLYNRMISFGYTLEKRLGIGGTIITMNGDNSDIDIKFFLFFGNDKQIKPILFRVLGYNSITFDVNDASETNRITLLLEEFFTGGPGFQ